LTRINLCIELISANLFCNSQQTEILYKYVYMLLF